MRPEPRERAAPRQVIAECDHLCRVAPFGDEDSLARRRSQHGRVEGDLASPVDRRDDRLRSDIEPVEAAAARRRQAGADNGTQRTAFGHRSSRRLRRHPHRWLRRRR